MNVLGATVSIILFFLIGIHHYIKHKELTGIKRFMQGKDVMNAIWNIFKSHEGIQLVCLVLAAFFMIS